MLFSDESLWLTSAASLTVFDISKAVENGVEITPEFDPSSNSIRYVSGIVLLYFAAGFDACTSHPKPFKCSIRARSPRALELIQQDTY